MPLSKIDKLFALLKGAKFLKGIDQWSGYYHIKLDEESIPKSAFMTMFENFEFLRLPFGLLQGLDFFIRIRLIYDLFGLDKSSHNSPGSGYLMYIDGILIYDKMEEEHLDMISKVFEY